MSAHDGRVCAACIADDGTLYTLRYVISDHPNGRCTSVPVVEGMPEVKWLAGEEWLKAQSDSTQIGILGAERFVAWQDGKFEFRDLVRHTDHPTWGGGLVPRSLKDLLVGKKYEFPIGLRVPVKPTVEVRLKPTAKSFLGERKQLQTEAKRVESEFKAANNAYRRGEISRLELEIARQKSVDAKDRLRRFAFPYLSVSESDRMGVPRLVFPSKMSKRRQKSITDAIETACAMVQSRDTLDSLSQSYIQIRQSKGTRANAARRLISLSPNDRVKTIIHEFGHVIEMDDKEIKRRARAFLRERTKGEKAAWLGDQYGKREMTKKNKFIHKYMGKQYRGATEIVSMGMEYMYSDPYTLARRDPEYFDFMVSILWGD